MTKDGWGEPLTGPEIKALGLPGDTRISAEDMPRPLRDWALLSDTPFYRLPADHPAYIVHRYNKEHGTNFVYWAGGDEAPGDWDCSAPVLYRNLNQYTDTAFDWSHIQSNEDIIGYTKKPQLATEEASEPLQRAASYTAPANHGPAADDKGEDGDFSPCERTVRMAIEKLGYAKVSGYAYGDAQYAEQHKICVDAVKSLLPQPKPDRAEELANEWMNRAYWPDMGVDMAVVEYTRDLIERGEIKE